MEGTTLFFSLFLTVFYCFFTVFSHNAFSLMLFITFSYSFSHVFLLFFYFNVIFLGDYFVVDNAAVHNAVETLPIIIHLLKAKGVQLLYLPKYSPELNPCELVFGKIKNYIRDHRNPRPSA